MKRFTLFGLLIVLLVTVAVANEPVKEFPSFFDWQVIENEPAENYTVLAVARVIDGDTFEFWLHIAPRLAYFADVRLAKEHWGQTFILRISSSHERVSRSR